MSNFALTNNITGDVINIIVANQPFIDSIADDETLTGADFTWIEYTDNDIVHIGGIYNKELGVFTEAQPFSDWILNQTNFIWEAPMGDPSGENKYHWCEVHGEWLINENQA